MPDYMDNVAAFAEAFGPLRAGLVTGLAAAPWPTPAMRDDFIAAITNSSTDPGPVQQ